MPRGWVLSPARNRWNKVTIWCTSTPTSFDVLVGSDQNIQIKADTSKLDKVEVTGAKESADFQTLMNFGRPSQETDGFGETAQDKKIDSLAFSNGLDKLSDEVTAYQKQLMDAHKGDWLEAFVKGTIPVDVPDYKELPDSTRELTAICSRNTTILTIST